MIDDLPIKLEEIDPDIECQSFFRTGSEVNLNELANLPRSILGMHGHSIVQNQINNPVARIEKESPESWIDELLEYSSNIALQTQVSLGRIKNDFLKNGLKFDADFRNHFLYIANNRLIESFDTFLIGLPREMKSNDCTINKPNVIPKPVSETAVDRSRAIEPPAKRKRVEDDVVIASSTKQVVNSTAVAAQSTQVTSQSIRSARTSSGSKIGSEISVKKVVSKVTETAASTSITMVNDKKNLIRRAVEAARASISNEKLVIRRTEEIPRMNVSQNRNNFDNTNNRLISTEKRVINKKNLERRKSIGTVVSIPTIRIGTPMSIAQKSNEATKEHQKSIPQEQQRINSKEKVTQQAQQIMMRRKTVADKEMMLNQAKNRQLVIASVKTVQPQLNVTLPIDNGIVTRSRRSAGDLARSINGFKCDVCNYTSEVRTNYQRHMLVHTGERPFKCKYCPKGFTQKVNLKSHLKSNHPNYWNNPNYWNI